MNEDTNKRDARIELIEEGVIIRVVDGDTIIVRFVDDECREEYRVRLIGIDAAESVAPEEWRNCEEGREASHRLSEMLPVSTHVWLQQDVSDVDEYGRLLRYVWLAAPEDADSIKEIREHMLNAILIEKGIAAPHSYPPDTSLDLLFEGLADVGL